jgi:hypothetical protein
VGLATFRVVGDLLPFWLKIPAFPCCFLNTGRWGMSSSEDPLEVLASSDLVAVLDSLLALSDPFGLVVSLIAAFVILIAAVWTTGFLCGACCCRICCSQAKDKLPAPTEPAEARVGAVSPLKEGPIVKRGRHDGTPGRNARARSAGARSG